MGRKNNTISGRLYVVATPIGNLQDISLRALQILKKVDLIACEDTRVTSKLVNEFDINTRLISFHQHSKITKINYIIDLIKEGNHVALVSDAGTPGISDPGGKLVEQVYQEGIEVVPIPGPSTVTTLLSASGLPADKFEFRGFVPHKKGRETFFKNISEANKTVVFYESVHRIIKTLKSLSDVLSKERVIVVGRELTKQFEEIKRGSATEISKYYEDNADKVKGEFAIVIGK